MTTSTRQIATRLNERRTELGLSCAVLAQRTGLGLRTVQRVLSGNESEPSFSTIASLARSMGVDLRVDEEDARAVRRRQAELKADRLVALVQGNSALEGQGLSDAAIEDLRERTIHELLAGPNRKLWAE